MKFKFFSCLSKKKLTPIPQKIQIILQNEKKVNDNKIFAYIHKINIVELPSEITLLTNIRIETIKNPDVEIHIHDYDTRYSLLLKINQIQSIFNYNDEITIKYFLYNI